MRAGLLCTGVKKRATMARNPWASKDFLLGVRLGDPTSGLVIARRCGLQGIEVDAKQEEVSQSSSVHLMKCLQELSKLKQELNEVEFKLHQTLMDKESQDLMHINFMAKHLESVDVLLNHLTAVLACKEQILNQLQSRSAETSLQVEGTFHKNLKYIVHSISPTLSEFHSRHSSIQDAASVDLTDLKQRMGSAVEQLVQCKDIYQKCHQLHSTQHEPKQEPYHKNH